MMFVSGVDLFSGDSLLMDYKNPYGYRDVILLWVTLKKKDKNEKENQVVWRYYDNFMDIKISCFIYETWERGLKFIF